MLGTPIGGIAGQTVTGTNLGPHTSYGSGKVTVWDKWGMYAVTLDAVDTSLTATTNIKPGDPLYATTAGKLTPTEASGFDHNTGTSTVIGRFVNFTAGRSLVTTPAYMANDLASHAATMTKTGTQVEFRFEVES